MFEGLLYQLLAGYLGHYFKDINRERFRLGLWTGEALLENVEVRLEAFDYLQLPFSIKRGFVGKLRLQVPWSKLGWEPVLIALEDVTLLAGPHEESEYAAEASERRALAAKKAGLAAAEIVKLSQRVSEDKSGETFVSYLSAKIIDNVQLTIKNVHIQYVDGKTDPKGVFSLGITLSSLSISTTDGRDHPVLPGMYAAGRGAGSPVYKLVELKDFAVYWNSDNGQVLPSRFSAHDSNHNTRHIMFSVEEDVAYLLHPTNATLRLTVNKKATLDGGGPQYSLAADVDNLSLALEDHQLIQMVLLMDVLSMSRLRERYARFRPQMSKADCERAGFSWQRRLWGFAIQAVLSDVRKQLRGSSWSYFSWRSGRQKRYVSLYKEKLEALQRVQPAGDQKWAELEEMEREFEMDEILYFRSLAENQLQLDVFVAAAIEPECDNNEANHGEADGQQLEEKLLQQPFCQRGWLNWLSLGLLGAAESIDAAVCPDEIIKDLCQAADFNPATVIDSEQYLKGQCRLKVSVRIGKAFGSLINCSTKKEIVSSSICGTLVAFSIWQESSSIIIIIPRLEVVDPCKPSSQFSRIVASKMAAREERLGKFGNSESVPLLQTFSWPNLQAKHIVRSSSVVSVDQHCVDGGGTTGIPHSSSDSTLTQANSYVQPEGIGYSAMEQTEPLMKVEVEINENTKDFEITVNMTIQPVELVLSPTFIDQILDFFSQPSALYNRYELVNSGSKKLESIAGHTRAKAEFAFATRKRVGWHLDIQNPVFLFPLSDMGTDGMLMVCEWESLFVASAELQSTASSSADMAAAQRLWGSIGSTRCYERLEIQLLGVEVMIVSQNSKWYEKLMPDTDFESHLVERFNVQLAVCCLPSDPTKMTHLKVSGEISSLQLHLSSRKCNAIRAVLSHVLESQKKMKNDYHSAEFSREGLEFSSWERQKLNDNYLRPRSSLQAQHSSSSEDSQLSQVAKSGGKGVVLELNLVMQVVTLQLSIDGQTATLLQQTTLVAQMQDTTMRYTQWEFEDEVQLRVSRVHIEDANESAGSSRRHLVFYSDGSSSAPNDRNPGCSGEGHMTSLQRRFNKNSFVLKLSSWKRHETKQLRLDLSFQGMEWHCHQKVIQALHGFLISVTETKSSAKPTEGQNRAYYPHESSDEQHISQMQGDLVSDVELVIEAQLKGIALHLYDPGGIIASLVLPDANASFLYKTSGKDMLKVVAIVREIRLRGPRWASGNIGGDPFGNSSHGPAGTLNITISKTLRGSYTGLEYTLVEVDVAVQNVQCIFLNDYCALLMGYCVRSEWKTARGGVDDGLGTPVPVDTSNTICVYKLEVSDSVMLFPQDCGSEEYMELNISKLLFSFTPADLVRIEELESHLMAGDSCSETVVMLDVVCIKCQDVSVIFHHFYQNPDGVGGNPLTIVERIDGEMTIRLPTSESSAEVIRNGSSNNFSINTEMNLSVLYINLAGKTFWEGVKLLKHYQRELSSISWKYKAYSSLKFYHGYRDRSPFGQLKPPPVSDSAIIVNSSISQLIIFVKTLEEPSLSVARFEAESLNIKVFLNEGVVDILKIELLSLDLVYGSQSKRLLNVGTRDVSREECRSGENSKPLLSLEHNELLIAVPCIKVWLHLAAWMNVITAVHSNTISKTTHSKEASVISGASQFLSMEEGHVVSPRSPFRLRTGSGRTEVMILKQESLFRGGMQDNISKGVERGLGFDSESSCRIEPPDIQNSKCWPFGVKVGVLNVVLILPDFLDKPKSHHMPCRFRLKQSVIQLPDVGNDMDEFSVGNQAEQTIHGETNVGKQIYFSSTVRIDEIQINKDGLSTLTACIMQAEAAVEENFGEGQTFHMRLLQAKGIAIGGQISLEQSPLKSSAFSLQVNSIDAWCSYNILHFLNKFHFEPMHSVSSPSSTTEVYFGLEIHIQSCSLLLSDGRWSCNAPIVEVLFGKIVAELVWRGFDIEASLSSELEINYHNIQKVAWEPVVEPWNACYKISRTLNSNISSSRPFRTKVEMTSSAPLNVNITEALVQAVSRTIEMFNDSWKDRSVDTLPADRKIRDPKSAENSSMRRYAPYWLQNDTGVPLYYWLCGSSTSKENDEDAKTNFFGSVRGLWGSPIGEIVQPGCSVPLYVEEGPDEMFHRRRAGQAADGYNAQRMLNSLLFHRMICVQLEGTSRPSVPMSIDLVGSIAFEAVFSDGDYGEGGTRLGQGSFQEIESERGGSFSASVIFEVTTQRYSKLVRLCSMVSLVNKTNVALELRFDIPFLISPKVMDPILPGHVMSLPVHLAETGRMRWRPLGNNHLWSEVQLLPNLLQPAESHLGFHRPIVCYPVHPSNGAFRCCLTVENHPIPAAEVVAAAKGKTERRDVVGSNIGADNLTSSISTGTEDLKGCILWDISLKPPLLVKNCLPCSLTITIETGAGVVNNVSAPEGDSVFVYDLDTMQDLTMTFLAPTYLPTSVKVVNPISSTEMGRNVVQDMKVMSTHQLSLKPEIITYASVTVEMETELDLVSGARELRIFAPFWLYNCSSLNLAVIDGDVDLYSGREQQLRGSPPTDEGRAEVSSLHSTGARSWLALASGLQVSIERLQPEASKRVVRRPSRVASHLLRTSSSQGPLHLQVHQRAVEQEETYFGDHTSDQEDNPKKGRDNIQMIMYSPTRGTDASELHLRARIVSSRAADMGKEAGEVVWSRPFLLEPPGGSTTVAIPQAEGNGAFVLAVISSPVLGSCAGKTKTITLRPRFLIANVSKQILCYKQQGTDKFLRLERGRHSQLHWHDVNREFLVSIRIDEHGWDWSGGFAPDQLGDTQVKVRNHTTGEMCMLRVEVSTMLASAGGAQGAGPARGSLGTCLILLSDDETGFMPYRIENFTLERLRFHQQKCEKMENLLQPYSACGYAWDEPCKPHRLVIEVPGAGDIGAFWLDEVKEYPPIILAASSEKAERRWLVHVRAEGPIRVLSIVDATVHTIRGGVDGMAVSGEQFQEGGQKAEPSSEIFEELVVKLSYVGFSIIDSYPQEVVYACAKGVQLQLLQGQHQQILKLEVAWFQIDNQLRYAVYPVMLSVAKTPPNISTISQMASTERGITDSQSPVSNSLDLEEAALSVSVAKWCNTIGSVDCFHYISMRVEPLRLELEERVVSCLLHMMERISWSTFTTDMNVSVALDSQPWSVLFGSQLYGVPMQTFSTTPWKYEMLHIPTSDIMRFTKFVKRLETCRCWAAAVAVEPINWQSQRLFLFAKERRKAYIEMLHVAPIVLSVSFSSAPWLSEEIGGIATRSLLWMTGTLLQRQVRALADVEGAPVLLRQLKLAHPFASWDVIWGMMTRHYTRQLLQEVYKVLGSADVFGNPVGFVRSMASGMWEFMSAPTRSSLQSPSELVRGVAAGTSSLFTNTVFAFSNAATRMSRAAQKGVRVFTMDSEYDQAMERLLQMEGSQEVSVVNEFLEGLTGLLQAPIRGAERHGLPGMLSGVALGAVGVIARPAASILEVAGMTAQSIRNRSRPTQWHATRVRLPRHVNDYSPLLLYSWERAVGQAVLLEAEGGRFKNEVYLTCKPLVQGHQFLLLTESKILRVSAVTLADTSTGSNGVTFWPKWKLELEGAIDDILRIDQVGNEVGLLLGPPIRPLVRPQHQAGGTSKYTTRFTPFAHETFKLVSKSSADEFLVMVRLLEEQHRRARSKLLLASSTSISCPDFLDLDKKI